MPSAATKAPAACACPHLDAPKGTRCECVGIAMIALPCLLYSMDLTVLNLAVDLDRRETKLAAHA